MARTPLLQVLHHPPQNPLLISIKPHMIAIDPENTVPPCLQARVLQSELHVGEGLVDLIEKVAVDGSGGGIPTAC